MSFLAGAKFFMSFTASKYTLYVVNDDFCGDDISYEVFGGEGVTVDVIPMDGTGKSEYCCLYLY